MKVSIEVDRRLRQAMRDLHFRVVSEDFQASVPIKFTSLSEAIVTADSLFGVYNSLKYYVVDDLWNILYSTADRNGL